MTDDSAFFDVIENIHPFSDSEFTDNDIPESELEQTILLSFLTRHYVPLKRDDLSEYISVKHNMNANISEINNALHSLSSKNLLNKDDNEYTLNSENRLVQVI